MNCENTRQELSILSECRELNTSLELCIDDSAQYFNELNACQTGSESTFLWLENCNQELISKTGERRECQDANNSLNIDLEQCSVEKSDTKVQL